MNDRMMQFKVGILVLTGLILTGILIILFGEVPHVFQRRYALVIHFDRSPGVEENTPVRKAGKRIGQVREVTFNEQHGGVDVIVDIERGYRLYADSRPRVQVSLLGDATIEFMPGSVGQPLLEDQARIEGEVAPDLLEVAKNLESLARNLEQKASTALDSVTVTSNRWNDVGERLVRVLDANDAKVAQILDRATESLASFQQAMQDAHGVLGDPQTQKAVRATLDRLPELAQSTQETLEAMRSAIAKANENLDNLKKVTEPLAQRTDSLLANLDEGAQKVNLLMGELTAVMRQLQNERGSFYEFVHNPNLYNNLDQAARSLNLVLATMRPAANDLKLFADKLARHPELIGVQGYLQGSSGLK